MSKASFNDFSLARDILTESDLYDKAKHIYKKIEIYGKLLRDDPSNKVKVLNDLAVLLQEKGNYEEAKQLLRRVIKIHKKIYGIQHSILATNLCNLGNVLRLKESFDEAEYILSRAVQID